jgi:hypothetical protein
MDKLAYDKIKEYCTRHEAEISDPERDFMVRKFCDSFYRTIEIKEVEKESPLTGGEINFIRDALLSDDTLNNSVTSAKNYFSRIENDYLDKFKKSVDRVDFWKSVWASVVASFFYSILLLFAFFVSKDQISSWVNSIENEQGAPQEQTPNKKLNKD